MIRKGIILADIADNLFITGDPVALILSDNTNTSPRDSAQRGQN